MALSFEYGAGFAIFNQDENEGFAAETFGQNPKKVREGAV